LFQDAIKTVAESGNRDVAENLLNYFVENKNPHCFAAALYTCYDLVRPDVVLELAWRNKMMEFIFPYLIQILREYTTKVDSLEAKSNKKTAKEGEESSFHTGPVPENPVPPYMTGTMGPINPILMSNPGMVINPLRNPQIMNTTGSIGLHPGMGVPLGLNQGMGPIGLTPPMGVPAPVGSQPGDFSNFIGFS